MQFRTADSSGLQRAVSTATDTGNIVGVDVTNAGTDQEQLPPMLDQLKERYDRVPAESLVDGGFASIESIDAASEKGNTVYAPLKEEHKQLAAGKDPYAKKTGNSVAVAMASTDGTAVAKQVYKLRRRRPSGSTPRRVTETCIRCRCVARPSVGSWDCSTRSPITC